MKKLLFAALLLAFAASSAKAQTIYNSVGVSVNAGNQSWATFYFGHLPNGQPGTSALVIECDYNRAEFIINFGVYGEQMTSTFFTPITCTQSGPTFKNGQRVVSFLLNSTPLFKSLTMYGRDSNGNLTTSDITLEIDSANWTVTGYGRTAQDSGSSQVQY